MRLISGFESQAATLNNYQLVTNSCKLAIFCSFLLSKLGNKILLNNYGDPSQLHDVPDQTMKYYDIKLVRILFCNLWSVVTNCSR